MLLRHIAALRRFLSLIISIFATLITDFTDISSFAMPLFDVA